MTPSRPAAGLDTVLVLGGPGLVGYQVCKRVALELAPRRVVLVALYQSEVRDAVRALSRAFPAVTWDGYYCDVFGRGDPVHYQTNVRDDEHYRGRESAERRMEIFRDTFIDFDDAYAASTLVRLMRATKPSVLVDCVNTATAISYQDVFGAARNAMLAIDRYRGAHSDDGAALMAENAETLVSSLSTPQLILHVRLLERAFREFTPAAYVKVGTTGTGGMGLNIPYTHGEDRPSPQLMTKTAIGFAHTGLLFLLARTPGMPIVKEIKPAAMIGYRAIEMKTIRGKVYGRGLTARVEPLVVTRARAERIGRTLDTTPRLDCEPLRTAKGRPRVLELPCVDTGENGLFTRGEFEAITSWGQMEYVTPEEIAELVVQEIRGANTGKDVIGAVDSSVLGPSYRAGMIRQLGLAEVESLEKTSGVPSVAIGRLGPPQLAKLLYEAHLLSEVYGTLDAFVEAKTAPRAMSEQLHARAVESGVADVAATLGIPTLLPDGKTLLRGPTLRLPEYNPLTPVVPLDGERFEFYAARTWIDLRPANMKRWVERLRTMHRARASLHTGAATEQLTRESYPFHRIRSGAVVAWIFANEMGGYRMNA